MRLVVAGDSYTYGHGLKDCIIEGNGYGPVPSKYAWPSIIADKLNIPCINLSLPGGSNDHMIKQVLENDLLETDIVVVMWSFFTREVYYEKDYIFNIGEWDEDYMKHKFRYSNVTDNLIKNLTSIAAFTSYLQTKKVQFYYKFLIQPTSVDVYPKYSNLKEKLLSYITDYDITEKTLGVLDKNELIKKYSKALDNNHPGEEWQKDLANLTLKHFNL